MNLAEAANMINRAMIVWDLVLGGATLVAPGRTLRVLGHRSTSPEAEALFQRCAPIWLTFSAAHAVAARRGAPRDWWALAWLRGTELLTDVLWSRSEGFSRPGSRQMLWAAGAVNLALAAGFGRLAIRSGAR